VKGGGHNVAGRGTIDGGLLIDLSLMRGVHVDPKARTARAQGGATWGEYNRETQVHGLASTGGVISTTGVGGLTLGGGIGWLMAKHGTAIDNLRSAQVVTPAGDVITASADENPDLFWGIRGGGGNFGIAASLEFDLHAVGPIVTGGITAHPFERARETLRFFRDTTAAALPDELLLVTGLIHSPDGAHKLSAIVACHCGPLPDGEAAVRPLKTFGPPVMDALGPMPYAAVNQMLDAAYPKGALNYWKSNFLATLNDAAIDTMIDCYSRVPSPMTAMLLEHFHGAATRVAVDATAFPHRSVGYNLVITSEWLDPADTDKNVKWTRETYAAMQPFMAPGRYVNYLEGDEGSDLAAAAYGPNYARLRQLKAKYDPHNFFHINLNVRP
jgi:FAD/FMN-containing dehydrogenase